MSILSVKGFPVQSVKSLSHFRKPKSIEDCCKVQDSVSSFLSPKPRTNYSSVHKLRMCVVRNGETYDTVYWVSRDSIRLSFVMYSSFVFRQNMWLLLNCCVYLLTSTWLTRKLVTNSRWVKRVSIRIHSCHRKSLLRPQVRRVEGSTSLFWPNICRYYFLSFTLLEKKRETGRTDQRTTNSFIPLSQTLWSEKSLYGGPKSFHQGRGVIRI